MFYYYKKKKLWGKHAAMKKHSKSTGLLILIRHGQSVWNRKPNMPEELWRYAGSVDVPLRYGDSSLCVAV